MKQKIFLALSVVYSLNFIFWDLSFADVFYWMNRTDYYREEFMNILSVVVAKGWMGLWGNSLVMFRLLGWLCCATAMVLPYVTLQPWKDAKQKLWLLALGFVLMGTGTFRLYNPDSLTLLWLSVGTVLLFKSFSSERQIYVWGLALTCALAAAARFPNILFCPLVAVLIIAESLIVKNTKRGGWAASILVLTGLFYVAIIILLSGRTDLWAYASDAIVNNKVGASHSVGNLVKNYLTSFGSTTIFFAIFAVVTTLMCKFLKSMRIAIMFIAGAAMFLLLKYTVYHSVLLSSVFAFGVLALSIVLAFRASQKEDKLKYVALCLIPVVAIAGSDTGMLKLFPYAAAILPLLLSKLTAEDWKNRGLQTVLASVTLFLIYNNTNDLRNNLWRIDNPCVRLVGTTKEQKADLEQQLALVKSWGCEGHNVFYGLSHAHALYAMTNQKPQWLCTFWMLKDDENELSQITRIMQGDDKMVLFDYSKSDSSYFIRQGIRLAEATTACNIYKR